MSLKGSSYSNRAGIRSAKYGCYECADHEECGLYTPCKYAAVLDKYASYEDYMRDTAPIMDAIQDAISMAGTQKWKEPSLILKNLDTGETYRHIQDAADKLGCFYNEVSQHLRGQSKRLHGQRLAWVPA